MRVRPSSLALSLFLIVAACSGKDSDDAAAAAPEDSVAAAPAPAADAAPEAPRDARATLAPDDLDRYERGTRKKVELLGAARQRLADARSANDTLDVLGSVEASALDREAASAAGVAVERWREIEEGVSTVLGRVEMGAMQGNLMAGVDTAALPAEQREVVRQRMQEMAAVSDSAYAGLSAETEKALRARADDLAKLRAEYIGALATMGR